MSRDGAGGPSVALAQDEAAATIKLSEPARKGGLPMMEALWLRASVRAWSERELSAQGLSDLLWAANGINRPDERRTAASAMNAQDVDIYVFMKAGVYLYNAAGHALTPVVSGDHRGMFGMPPGGRGPGAPAGPPPPGAAAPPAAAVPPPAGRTGGPPAVSGLPGGFRGQGWVPDGIR